MTGNFKELITLTDVMEKYTNARRNGK